MFHPSAMNPGARALLGFLLVCAALGALSGWLIG